MQIIIFIAVGIFLYFFISGMMMVADAYRLVLFYKDNMETIPDVLPKHIQRIKEELGDESFNELYENFKERRNE